jgi:hypothetical protein
MGREVVGEGEVKVEVEVEKFAVSRVIGPQLDKLTRSKVKFLHSLVVCRPLASRNEIGISAPIFHRLLFYK